ncbi:MAG: flagellar basal body rod protein FlgC [Zymomonas mobilis subsp. pomaceae]|uniref:Flagellar basal-body rod protein FlgC n=1 Tax=Zymomonas mobilis subsp. pomaceae (strain ATCC 29192 / DSM 22645 / JCM 10191 / CCUG 17912 / NBRC 13757 / NCIMB 11200 / NRRL B-4491 / Barker I) TaxID=579138 RepID=F8ERQ2_ZYMMT|nr:flagellar basal body rod protein FlgC [Zymomonas mobilis]AEI37510.1 flagellar basal-body rod protein FlgC [Zymomonas mobilis subsp. pomaceae ATCC 29192]MDX5948878.1 flagellar basal body rod protein FlgC [Zymomonas mobilis subsp. pomaceae]GEB88685.1 flagellar basal-body rod protein FlgC [Zymomonas mobilis subsp. pomaceae]
MDRPLSVFDISGRAMSAQLVRLNTNASNLANANSVASSRDNAFRALKPIFSTVTQSPGVATVQVQKVVATDTQPTQLHDPTHPLADENGNVWSAGVDTAQEMVEMIETARDYQNNVQVMQTAKSLTLDTLKMER